METPARTTPATSRARRRALGALAAAGALGLGWGIAAWRVAAGRVLHVVNGTPSAATFRIDGGSAGEVPPRSLAQVVVGEGRHAIEVATAGGTARTHDVVLETPLAARFTARPAWVVNVGGAAGLLLEEEEYGEGAAGRARPPEVLFGDEWVALDGVDVAFGPFPAQAASSDPRGAVVRRLDVLAMSPVEALGQLAPARRMDWAELHLRLAPEDEALLVAYRDGAVDAELVRLTGFLEAGLDRRPVVVVWHRAWQDALRAQGKEQDALARADAALAAEPRSSALHYLRGRLCGRADDALAAYEVALALDPADAWALHARGLLLGGRGDVEGALACAEEACRLRPGDEEMAAARDDARLAAGRLDALEADLRAALDARPRSLGALRRLVEVCAERGDLAAARAAQAGFARAVESQAEGDARRAASLGEAALLEVAGDVASLASLVPTLPPTVGRQVHALGVALARRDLAAAERLLGLEAGGPPVPVRLMLAVSIGAALAGDPATAERVRRRAAERLADPSKGARDRAIADLLRRVTPPALEEVRALPLAPGDAALLLLALACADRAAGRPLVLAARPLVARGQLFPARFLREAADAMAPR